MFSHGWSVRALPLRKAPLGALSIMLIVLAVLGAVGSAHGGPGKRADKTGGVDTEHMFGFTVEPHWGFADEMSGAPADQQRAAFRLLADRELIPGRLFAALNVIYEPEQTRLRGSGETLRDSTLGVSAALAMQVMPGVFIGAEARNLRHYDGLGLDGFAGQALYIGPTLYATFAERYFISAAWNVQVWGAVRGTSGALDFDNFERHQVKLRVGLTL